MSEAAVPAAAEPTCLCIKEGLPGLQVTGVFRNGVFVRQGVIVCDVCEGSGISPRARAAGATAPTEEPITEEELAEFLDDFLAGRIEVPAEAT